MRSMVLTSVKQPLALQEIPVPVPAARDILIRVHACGVCRTDLHVVDGELPAPKLPLIPGHEIVGKIAACGSEVKGFQQGQWVGVPWLGGTCRACTYCLSGRENLCDHAVFTGYLKNGGYADYAVADADFCFPLPEGYRGAQGAPLLCAGLIGWRSYKLARSYAPGLQTLGLYGFGAAGHIVIQIANFYRQRAFAFTRPGGEPRQEFARKMGASWAGGSNQMPPEMLDAAIIFAPVGSLIPLALKAVRKAGVVVCAGIHMSDIPSFPYELVWGERVICSVANLTREDAREFLNLAPSIPIDTSIKLYSLEQSNKALCDLRDGLVEGAAVLRITDPEKVD